MSERIFGLHAVEAALKSDSGNVTGVWVQRNRKDRRVDAVLQRAREAGLKVDFVDRSALDALAPDARHQGVIAEVRAVAAQNEDHLDALLDRLAVKPLLLILDGVQDPHNLGACLRTAEAAGVHAVIAPRDRAVGLTAVARKVAAGAAERVPFVQVTNLARTLRGLQDRGIWLVGTTGGVEQNLYDVDFKGSIALVMGAEGEGMRRLTREHCDQLVTIPMSGEIESLNVSVATGVCLYEAVRQRRLGGKA
ncbi:MAG: 23S rRNA (guanosine(2251)-2'-O)-methyltransferase RlmB [Gammaproteobacteria bacterium]|nr:23S rRNA (guanosine(2251)-2'-O)-methyltransferase RlmB [Gammaproteobacteria bacterium]MCP5135963.1 23S rRNA (guanosine(2251)-2'-O)-methyltransferase RlmB [Gammaproteobacteria bacterium]